MACRGVFARLHPLLIIVGCLIRHGAFHEAMPARKDRVGRNRSRQIRGDNPIIFADADEFVGEFFVRTVQNQLILQVSDSLLRPQPRQELLLALNRGELHRFDEFVLFSINLAS